MCDLGLTQLAFLGVKYGHLEPWVPLVGNVPLSLKLGENLLQTLNVEEERNQVTRQDRVPHTEVEDRCPILPLLKAFGKETFKAGPTGTVTIFVGGAASSLSQIQT